MVDIFWNRDKARSSTFDTAMIKIDDTMLKRYCKQFVAFVKDRGEIVKFLMDFCENNGNWDSSIFFLSRNKCFKVRSKIPNS